MMLDILIFSVLQNSTLQLIKFGTSMRSEFTSSRTKAKLSSPSEHVTLFDETSSAPIVAQSCLPVVLVDEKL
jgi:hypothetical protein